MSYSAQMQNICQKSFVCIVLLVVFSMLAGQPAAGADDLLSLYTGKVIRDIRITCVTSAEVEKRVWENITLRQGESLVLPKIRESIRKIYALKRFSQVSVEAEFMDGGVSLSFCPVEIRTISKIQIAGNQVFTATRLLDVLNVKVNDQLGANQVQKLAQNLLKFYQDHGYAQVQAAVQFIEEPGGTTGVLTVDIQEGEPGRIGSVVFTGQTAFSAEELMSITKLRAEAKFTPETMEQAIERLKSAYLKKHYFEMQVTNQEVRYRQETGQAEIHLNITEGPRTDIRIEGNERIPLAQLQKLLTFSTKRDVEESGLEKYVQALTTYYQNQGFYFAQITAKNVDENDAPTIVFTIAEGPQVEVQALLITGNQAFSTKTLRGHMFTNTGGLFSKGWYRESVFQEDLLAIKAFYQQKGFLEAEVTTVSKEFSDDRQQVTLALTVHEGVQTRVADIKITGEPNEAFVKKFVNKSALRIDQPFNIADVTQTVERIKEVYANQGYINVQVDVTPDFTPDKTAVTVTFRITPGQRFYVGRIFVQGVVTTRLHFVRRELRLKEGDVYSPQKIRDTVRGLLQLGIYDSVTFRRLDTKSLDPMQDLVLEVRETSTQDVEFGVGYSTESGLRGFVEYSDKNFFNYGGKGSARTELSLERPKLTLQYLQPHLLSQDTYGIASLFNEMQRDNDSFKLEERGGRLMLRHNFQETLSLSLGYYFEQNDPSDVKDAAKLSSLDTEVLNLGGFEAQFLWDRRDDLIQPKRGSFSQVYLRSAAEFLGSESNFFEMDAQNSWYVSLASKTVLACSFNAKLIEPTAQSSAIPIYRRYFWGGDNTLRGFEKHEVGPHATDAEGKTVNIGGNRVLGINAELRFPIYSVFGGVVFYDAGANWLHENGFNQDLIRDAVGIGLRVSTPVGPLRFDYGWKLDRESGESAGEYYITIGATF